MKINQFYNVLRAIKLFRNMDDKQLDLFFRFSQYIVKDFKKNSIVALEGELCKSWDIILSGELKVQRIDEEGRILTITEFDVGDSIGGNLLFSNTPMYPMTVIAKTDVTLVRINRDMLLNLCINNRENLINYLEIISDKTQILTNKIKSVMRKSIRESICEYLRYQYMIQGSTTIRLNTSKKDLANRFGVQRTSLSRELNKMKQDRLISYNNKEIRILDTSIIEINKC